MTAVRPSVEVRAEPERPGLNDENRKPLFRAVRLADVFLAGEVLVWLVLLAGR